MNPWFVGLSLRHRSLPSCHSLSRGLTTTGLDIRSTIVKRTKFRLQESGENDDQQVGQAHEEFNPAHYTYPTNADEYAIYAGPVHCPVDGVVIQRVNYGAGSLYWSLMVRDAFGFVWQVRSL